MSKSLYYGENNIPTSKKIKKLLEKNYPIRIDSIEQNKVGGSIVYIVNCNSIKYLFKLYTPILLARAFDFDIAFQTQEFLFKNKVNVPEPVRTDKNEISIKVVQLDKICYGYLFKFINGESIDIENNEGKIFEVVTDIHVKMTNFDNKLPVFDYDFYFNRQIEIFNQYCSSEQKAIYKLKDITESIWDKINVLPRGFSHGDLGTHNMIKRDKKIYVYDFDSVSLGFKMFDISLCCDCNDFFNFSKKTMNESKEMILKFSDYYSRYIPISQKEIDMYVLFYIMRYFEVTATVTENHIYKGIDDFLNKEYIDRIYEWVMQAVELVR